MVEEGKVEEKQLWSKIPWSREKGYKADKVIGTFCVRTVIENSVGHKLLDIGCGDGLLIKQFAPHFPKIIGLDASKQHLNAARKKCKDKANIEFVHSLVEEFEPKQKFNTISLINILEHVDKPVAILKRVSQWLSKNGVVVIIVPNALTLTRKIACKMGILKNEYELTDWDLKFAGHRRHYDLKHLKRDIRLAGLRTVNSGGILLKTVSGPQLDYLLESHLWDGNNYYWGGEDKNVDWRLKYCESCYEVGKSYPSECTSIYIAAS